MCTLHLALLVVAGLTAAGARPNSYSTYKAKRLNNEADNVVENLVIVVQGNIEPDFAHRNGYIDDEGEQVDSSWPSMQADESILYIPRKLNPGDEMIIEGELDTTSSDKILVVKLMSGTDFPDYNNVACQLSSTASEITLLNKVNGDVKYQENIPESDGLIEDSFRIKFIMTSRYGLNIKSGDNDLSEMELDQNLGLDTIKFLSLRGNISKLSRIQYNFKNTSN